MAPTPPPPTPGAVPIEPLPDMSRPIRTPARRVGQSYARDLPPISAADAEAAEPLFAEESAPRKSPITISTTVQHRGRVFTITATDMKLDAFCDLLETAGYAAPAPQQWQTLPDGTPICPKHNTPMRKREKQGDEWWSHRVFGSNGEELFCKGYHGKDSPGYEH